MPNLQKFGGIKHNKMPSEQAGYGYEAPYIYKLAIEKRVPKETSHELK